MLSFLQLLSSFRFSSSAGIEGSPSLWESRSLTRPAASAAALVASPGRDNNEEDLRADALKTIGKSGHSQQQQQQQQQQRQQSPRLHLDVSADPKASSSGLQQPPTPLVKEILEEQPKDGVDPRNRMLLRNAWQHRGNRRYVALGGRMGDVKN